MMLRARTLLVVAVGLVSLTACGHGTSQPKACQYVRADLHNMANASADDVLSKDAVLATDLGEAHQDAAKAAVQVVMGDLVAPSGTYTQAQVQADLAAQAAALSTVCP
jgi:hypothetical protein